MKDCVYFSRSRRNLVACSKWAHLHFSSGYALVDVISARWRSTEMCLCDEACMTVRLVEEPHAVLREALPRTQNFELQVSVANEQQTCFPHHSSFIIHHSNWASPTKSQRISDMCKGLHVSPFVSYVPLSHRRLSHVSHVSYVSLPLRRFVARARLCDSWKNTCRPAAQPLNPLIHSAASATPCLSAVEK